MANQIDSIDLDDRDTVNLWGHQPLERALTVDQQKEDQDALRVHRAALPHITPVMPRPIDASLNGRVTIGAPAIASRSSLNDVGGLNRTAKKKATESVGDARADDVETLGEQLGAYKKSLEEVAGRLEDSPKPPQFPYPALEAILAGVAKGEQTNDKLREYVKEMDKLQKDLSLLLDLNAKLNTIKDDVAEMPKDLRDLLDELKERGMDIWPSDRKDFSKEIKSEIKSMSGAHQDKAKSNLHIITSAKIQHLTATLSALWECIKDICRRDDAQKKKCLHLQGQG